MRRTEGETTRPSYQFKTPLCPTLPTDPQCDVLRRTSAILSQSLSSDLTPTAATVADAAAPDAVDTATDAPSIVVKKGTMLPTAAQDIAQFRNGPDSSTVDITFSGPTPVTSGLNKELSDSEACGSAVGVAVFMPDAIASLEVDAPLLPESPALSPSVASARGSPPAEAEPADMVPKTGACPPPAEAEPADVVPKTGAHSPPAEVEPADVVPKTGTDPPPAEAEPADVAPKTGAHPPPAEAEPADVVPKTGAHSPPAEAEPADVAPKTGAHPPPAEAEPADVAPKTGTDPPPAEAEPADVASKTGADPPPAVQAPADRAPATGAGPTAAAEEAPHVSAPAPAESGAEELGPKCADEGLRILAQDTVGGEGAGHSARVGVGGEGTGAGQGIALVLISAAGGGGLPPWAPSPPPRDPVPPSPLALNHVIRVLGTLFRLGHFFPPAPSAHLSQGSLVIELVSLFGVLQTSCRSIP